MEGLGRAPNKIDRGISLIIYSDPGIGKTTLAGTLPVGETLIINTEAGIGPLLGSGHYLFNVGQAVINTKLGLEKVMSDLYQKIRTRSLDCDDLTVKNVVIDNVSELIDQLTIFYTEGRNKEFPEIKERGDAAYKLLEWVHNWRDLVDMGINVVFNAWEFPYELRNTNGTVITQTTPMVGQKAAQRICGLVDVVGHLENNEKTDKRWIRFGPSRQYLTKTQFQGLEAGEPPDLSLILNKLNAYNYEKEEINDDDGLGQRKTS